ncbi:MAG: hypothetical protein HKP55_05965 [Gammaproteobacteria bacterium]|nr:hypothetical protein [Gammaproteobacteria bacterium]NNJ91200.1 hypothetical protein [Gammaproteobacteria bacterium]
MVDQVSKNPSLVLAVTRRIFRPIARFLLANGVTLPAIHEMVKQVLVEVAVSDFPVKGKATTDSRISVFTGVHRKDVKRLRNTGCEAEIVPKAVSLGSQIVNVWMTEKKWLSRDKKPLDLPRSSPRKGMKSFELLVESISKDVRSRSVLDELLRSGAVEVIDDYVYLKTEAFIPKEGLEESLYYLGRGISSHLNAAISNVQGEEQPFFDRMVHYDSIPSHVVKQLDEYSGKQAMEFLKNVNRSAKKQSRKSAEDLEQMTVGVYIYHTPLKQPRDETEK